MVVLGPLGEGIGFTTPRISPTVTGHLETDTITTRDDALGDTFITNHIGNWTAFTLHMTSVGSVLTNTGNDH